MSMKALQNGKVILTSLRDGNNLSVRGNGVVAFDSRNEGIQEQLTLEVKGDKYFFVAHTGNVIMC